jgi:hypothetical protein
MVSEPSRVGGGGYVRAVPGPLTLRAVEAAVRASWGPDVMPPPPGPLGRGEAEYLLLRARVLALLSGD